MKEPRRGWTEEQLAARAIQVAEKDPVMAAKWNGRNCSDEANKEKKHIAECMKKKDVDEKYLRQPHLAYS